MKISVIAIFYNSSLYCKKCIDSILSQQGEFSIEIIAIDDGSQDDTFSILNSYVDSRLIVVRHHINQGISAARNTGLKHITGECFYFIDGDDFLPANALSDLCEHYTLDVDWVQGGYAMCDEYGNVSSIRSNITKTYEGLATIMKNFDNLEFVYTHNRLINSKWRNIMFPEGKAHEDRFWNITVFPYLTKVCNISNVTYCYICHPQSFSNKSRKSELYIDSALDLLQRMRDLPPCWHPLADHFQVTAIEKNLYLFSYKRTYRKKILNELKAMPHVQVETMGFPRFTHLIHSLVKWNVPDYFIYSIACLYRIYVRITNRPI